MSLSVEAVKKVPKQILGRDAEKSDLIECATIYDLIVGEGQVTPENVVLTRQKDFSYRLVIARMQMVKYRSVHRHLFRYDAPNVSALILQGSIKVTTLEACRTAEKEYFRDQEEGTRTTTSLPGTNSLDTFGLAKLLGVDPAAIRVSGENAVVTVGENAVHRRERLANAFIFCASALENDPYMKARFGAGCVKITNSVAFFEVVDEHLRRAVSPKELQMCVVDDVEYAPRTNNYRDHTDKHVAFLKPNGGQSTFEKECEVRAVWIPRDFDIEPMFLRIPATAAFLEAITTAWC